MTGYGWSALLAAVGLTSLYLLSRGSWTGWVVGLADEVLWVVYAVVTGQLPFVVSAVAYGAVYAQGLRTWRRQTTGAR